MNRTHAAQHPGPARKRAATEFKLENLLTWHILLFSFLAKARKPLAC